MLTLGYDKTQSFTGIFGGDLCLWELPTGRRVARFQGEVPQTSDCALSPDGRYLATIDSSVDVCVWDLAAGRPLRSLPLRGQAVALTAAGQVVASNKETVQVMDVGTGTLVRRFARPLPAKGWPGTDQAALTQYPLLAVSADGRWGREDRPYGRGVLWGRVKSAALGTVGVPDAGGVSVGLSPHGNWVATGGGTPDLTARLWESATGKEVGRFEHRNYGYPNYLAPSPDGRRLFTGGRQEWDVATGEELNRSVGKGGKIAFLPDGQLMVAQNVHPQLEVRREGANYSPCTLFRFRDGTWAVIDEQGRFDASNGGDVEGLHWVVGNEPIALKQLKERYYDPGLLAKYLGFNKEPLRQVAAFTDVKLFPDVAVTQVDTKKPRMNVALTNRGGGIGRVVVLVNGKELSSDARPRGAADSETKKLDLQLDLSNDPRLVPGRKNTVEVLAYNAEGYLSSRGLVREFDAPGVVATNPPHLHAVIVGVSKYQGAQLNLRYPAKDAEDFATALRLAAGRLFGTDKVTLTLFTTAEARPNRANLVKALEALKATKPDDLVVVYLAGHGVTHGGQDGDWHYLTADAMSADLADPAVRKAVSLSSAELTEMLKAAPAQKQVLILDTCHSGRVVEKLTEKREVPGSQVRALERVKDRTGVHVLAGCAADSVSYEASRYGQGILTYSLLLGMRGAKLRDGEYVDIVDLFSFAADKVPELARDIGGVQRPTVASPRGASFDVGRLTAEDRSKVPLQAVKPIVLRASFQDEKRVRDVLGLSKLVDDRLREASSAPRGAKLVFVDAAEFPGALLAAGRYKQDGDKVTVSVTLFEGEKEVALFTVEGAAGKPDELAARIAAEIEKKLAASSGK